MKNFELKNLRLKNRITQKTIANLLDVDVSTYTKKENGQIVFSIKEVSAIKDFFKLSDAEIVKIFLK
ncbi:helix-turn-helix domain-containing protein [Romboutsia lituseburensis]|uniref:helix-turn-helix domain-containing protein n=1 Tax=Romboutsia lituseburensis TaxID=1537 RepID=UPI00215A1D4C|nr:helix-turn-helix domain-containing protein [Romboutsia lituseburensis]MCR8744372.1 helix-turn-helix domain-containing protein [Romboutsia lituseburensis]